MRRILAPLVGAALALAPTALALPSAHAAACCSLSAPGRSGRLPEGEVAAALLGYGLETRPGVWTSDGEVRFAHDDAQITQTWTAQAIVRPARAFQAAVALPFMLNVFRYGEDVMVGVGPGDLRLIARVEPFPPAPTTPGFSLAVSLPTGRAVHQIHDGNPAAATGTGHAVLTPGFSLDRAFAWGSVGGDLSAGFSLPRSASEVLPGIAWSGNAFFGFIASRRATITATFGVRGSSPGFVGGQSAGGPQVEPWGGAGLVLEPVRFRRLSVGLEGSIPIPRLGRGRAIAFLLSVGGSLAFPSRAAEGAGP